VSGLAVWRGDTDGESVLAASMVASVREMVGMVKWSDGEGVARVTRAALALVVNAFCLSSAIAHLMLVLLFVSSIRMKL